MREVVTCIHPVRIHGTQILNLQPDQRSRQFSRVSQFLGKLVGLEFVAATEDVHQELDDGIHGCKSVREEDETDYYGVFIMEPKGFIKRFVVDKHGEEGKDIEEVNLENIS